MIPEKQQPGWSFARPEARSWRRGRRGPRRYRAVRFELLEPRVLLDGVGTYNDVSPAWFAEISGRQTVRPGVIYGPLAAAVGASSSNEESSGEVAQWIVRLTEPSTQEAGSVPGGRAPPGQRRDLV
jgi:hypothetical protein